MLSLLPSWKPSRYTAVEVGTNAFRTIWVVLALHCVDYLACRFGVQHRHMVQTCTKLKSFKKKHVLFSGTVLKNEWSTFSCAVAGIKAWNLWKKWSKTFLCKTSFERSRLYILPLISWNPTSLRLYVVLN